MEKSAVGEEKQGIQEAVFSLEGLGIQEINPNLPPAKWVTQKLGSA